MIAQDTDMTYERFYLLSEMCGFYVCFICYLLILFYSFDYIPEYDFFRLTNRPSRKSEKIMDGV